MAKVRTNAVFKAVMIQPAFCFQFVPRPAEKQRMKDKFAETNVRFPSQSSIVTLAILFLKRGDLFAEQMDFFEELLQRPIHAFVLLE